MIVNADLLDTLREATVSIEVHLEAEAIGTAVLVRFWGDDILHVWVLLDDLLVNFSYYSVELSLVLFLDQGRFVSFWLEVENFVIDDNWSAVCSSDLIANGEFGVALYLWCRSFLADFFSSNIFRKELEPFKLLLLIFDEFLFFVYLWRFF